VNEVYWEIKGMEEYKVILKYILLGREVKVRGKYYKEIIPALMAAKPQPPEFFEQFPSFSVYMAKARAEYIIAKIPTSVLVEIGDLFDYDPNTRQAVIYKPDWYWDEQPKHVNCILAYQFLKRDEIMDLHVFMRSSDFFNAFPYDWFAASEHLEGIVENEAEEAGNIYWHISNLHVRKKDIPKINAFLKRSPNEEKA